MESVLGPKGHPRSPKPNCKLCGPYRAICHVVSLSWRFLSVILGRRKLASYFRFRFRDEDRRGCQQILDASSHEEEDWLRRL